jgi:hypothetical protein
MAEQFGIYTEEIAKEVLRVVRQLQSSGSVGSGFTEDINKKNGNNQPGGIFVYNDSEEIVPAYAFMQATTTQNEGVRSYIKIEKPIDSTILRCPLLINGPTEIPVGGYGMAQNGPVYRLKCETIPVLGDRMGPTTGEWLGFLGSMYAVIGADEVEEDVFKVMFDTSSWRGKTKTAGLTVGTPALVKVYDAAGTLRSTEYTAETAVSNIAGDKEIELFSQYGRWFAVGLC